MHVRAGDSEEAPEIEGGRASQRSHSCSGLRRKAPKAVFLKPFLYSVLLFPLDITSTENAFDHPLQLYVSPANILTIDCGKCNTLLFTWWWSSDGLAAEVLIQSMSASTTTALRPGINPFLSFSFLLTKFLVEIIDSDTEASFETGCLACTKTAA
jgi:hypothetical protein